jgi:glycylpeptide N-tetradecanoyltransferase
MEPREYTSKVFGSIDGKLFQNTTVNENFEVLDNQIGPIDTNCNVENVSKIPLKLPNGFFWEDIDTSDEHNVERIYQFYKHHQMESWSRPKEYIKFKLNHPGRSKSFNCAVVKGGIGGELVGFICATPIKLSVFNKEIQMVDINMLTVHKSHQHHKLSPVLMKEIGRRVNLQNIWYGVYSLQNELPLYFTELTHYTRFLNVSNIIKTNAFDVPKNLKPHQLKSLFSLPKQVTIDNLRLLEEKDLPKLINLFTEHFKKFSIYPIFSLEELSYIFLPKDGAMFSYVVENVEMDTITDFFSFVHANQYQHSPEHEISKNVCGFYFIQNTVSFKDLVKNAMILAKNLNFDTFSYAANSEVEGTLKDMLFNAFSSNHIYYYFYNYVCPKLDSKTVGINLLY